MRPPTVSHIPLHHLSGTGLTAQFGGKLSQFHFVDYVVLPAQIHSLTTWATKLPTALLRLCCTRASSV